MSFISFTDQWAILLDDHAMPLNGRVIFYDYNTSAPKEIYSNVLRTVLAENPMYTNLLGQLEYQIFLGIGDYTLEFQRYIGTGDMKAIDNAEDPMQWITYKREDVAGLSNSSIGTGSIAKAIVESIADLRLVDKDLYITVEVIGYYAKTDNIKSRTYSWSPSNTQTDNYGTIIQKTGESTGRWLMGEEEEIDSRYFGVFPDGFTHNSELSALISWCSSSYSKCKTIRFSTGLYVFINDTFNFTNKVIIEPNVKFGISGSGLLNINFYGEYEILTNVSLVRNQPSLSNVVISFLNPTPINKVINSNWFFPAGQADDYATLQALSTRTLPVYDIKILGTYVTISSDSFIIFNNKNISFEDGSIFSNGSSVYFNDSTLERTGDDWTSLSANTFLNFTFNNCTIRSSLFNNNSPTDTINLSLVLDSLSYATTNTAFIFDMPNNIFNGTCNSHSDGFKFSHEKGLLYNIKVINSGDAIINNLESSESKLFSTAYAPIIIKNKKTLVSNYFAQEDTNADQCLGFWNALYGSTYATGELDLCGKTIHLTTGFTLNDSLNATKANTLTVMNGEFVNTANYVSLLVNCSMEKILYSNVYFSGPGIISLVLVQIGGLIKNLTFDKCHISFNFGASQIYQANTGINSIQFIDSYVKSPYIGSNGDLVYEVLYSNCKNVYATEVYLQGKPSISNSTFSSITTGANFVKVTCSTDWDTNISDSYFNNTQLKLHSSNATLNHKVNNCTFDGTSNILIAADQVDTIISGLNITNNSFTGGTSAIICIDQSGTFSTGTSAVCPHKLNISNNISSAKLLKQTKNSNWTQWTLAQYLALGNTASLTDHGIMVASLLDDNVFLVSGCLFENYNVVGNVLYFKHDGTIATLSPAFAFIGGRILANGQLKSAMYSTYNASGTSNYIAVQIAFNLYS